MTETSGKVTMEYIEDLEELIDTMMDVSEDYNKFSLRIDDFGGANAAIANFGEGIIAVLLKSKGAKNFYVKIDYAREYVYFERLA